MENFKSHILVIDDDEGIRSLLKQFLNENGYLVNTASNALEAKEKISIIKFDLLVLDIMMPGNSGLEFISENKNILNVPIILLTAKGEASERVEGLETGADDYLPKPFEPKELLLRLNSILRRLPKVKVELQDVKMGEVIFSLQRGELNRNKQQVRLTDVEGALLGALANHPGEILSREELINLTGASGDGRAIDVQVTRLRRKIEKNAKVKKRMKN